MDMKEHHGLLFGILSAFSSSLMYVFVKLSSDLPIPTIIFSRFFIGLVLLMPWFLRSPLHLSFKYVPQHMLRDLTGIAGIGCYYYAILKLPLVNASTLANTFPIFIPIIMLIGMQKMISKQRLAAMLLGFAGVLFILRPSEHIMDPADLIALLGSLFAAIAAVVIRELSRVESTQAILFAYFVTATVIAAVPMAIMWQPIVDPMHWLYLAGVGVCGTLYQYFMTMSYTHAPVSKAGMMSYFNVFFVGIFGWIFWGETLSFWVIVGVSLIMAGGCLALFDKTPSRKISFFSK